jgi:uncharacterized protein
MTNLEVFECTNCQKKFVQRKWICPDCQQNEFKIIEIKGEGKVYSHTTIHISSKEFEHLTPYTIALVELSNGLRITGRITEPVEINESVTLSEIIDNAYVFIKNE